MATTWEAWKQHNREKIAHIVGFEEIFVDTVLARIALITPDDVVPQYHFKDDKGGDRYIDFMILNRRKGFCVPIELDGLSKLFIDGREYHKFNDFLERQNALITEYGIVLRYTNKKMLNDNQSIIKEITETLQRQSQNKTLKEITEQQTHDQISDYESTIQQLQAQAANSTAQNNNTQQLAAMIAQMQTQLADMRRDIHSSSSSSSSAANGPTAAAVPAKSPSWYKKMSTGIVSITMLGVIGVVGSQLFNKWDNSSSMAPVKPEYPVGVYAKVCGTVAQLKEFSKGTYLNLGAPYPNQFITIVLWNVTAADADSFAGQTVCTEGTVTEYKGRKQVEVQYPSSISIHNSEGDGLK